MREPTTDARGEPRAATERDRVLVIENDAMYRQALTDALTLEGYDVIEAATAEEGLALVHAYPPPVVIVTDLGLDGPIDGVTLTAMLRGEHATRDLGIIAVSGCVEPDWSIARHFDAYLRKPVDFDLLVDLVGRLAVAARSPWKRTAVTG